MAWTRSSSSFYLSYIFGLYCMVSYNMNINNLASLGICYVYVMLYSLCEILRPCTLKDLWTANKL